MDWVTPPNSFGDIIFAVPTAAMVGCNDHT